MIKLTKVPTHLAMILDGNGRWAIEHKKTRNYGHLMGVKNLKEIVKLVKSLNIKYLTLYCFSVDNMKRPTDEVNYLFDLAKDEFNNLLNRDDSINIRIIGERSNLPSDLLKLIDEINSNDLIDGKFTLFICFNYSSRLEIISASMNSKTKEEFESKLYTYPAPPIDFLIRTSGEQRLSDFMLYQMSYAEMYFDKVYWPSFNEKHLMNALKNYEKRKRNFGKI